MNANEREKPVVVAVQGDQPMVVAYAAGEALRRGAHLVVLHVYGSASQDLKDVSAISALPQEEDAANAVLDQARKVIDGLDEAPHVLYTAQIGTAIETIEMHAADAQLLVVGADEISWFERILNGAIARHLAEHAACPVIVVPPMHDLDLLYGGVCVAIDTDAFESGPVRFAFEEASARKTTLVVLHVVPEGAGPEGVESGRIGVAEVLAGWRDEFPDVHVTPRVIHGDDVVAAAAHASEQSELLVVGRPGHRLLNSRTVASRLTREAHAPLAIVDQAYGSTGAKSTVDSGATRE
jgi:nucleotide-binding universal stress UspA family protein